MKNYIKPEFVEFETPDKLKLPGLLYSKKSDKTAVIHLHGNGSYSVFYDEMKNQEFASKLFKKDISVLYFNNRGAHIIKRIRIGKNPSKSNFGMAYEKIKECIADIDGAVRFLKKKGYNKFYLSGASTGANKICVYNYYKPKNTFSGYILICGGDDTGIYYDLLGGKRFWKILNESKKKIKEGKGEEIIKDLLPENVFSYKGFYDIANPDGDYNVFPFLEVKKKLRLSSKPLFRHFKSIKKPTLVVYGDKDEFVWNDLPSALSVLKSHQPEMTYAVIEDADHGFSGKGKQLFSLIAKWIAE